LHADSHAFFGIEKYSTVGSAVARVKTRTESDAGFGGRVEAIKEEVLSPRVNEL